MNHPSFDTPVIVLHVKNGYEERGQHMESMLVTRKIPFVYILDGDIPDITPEILDRYFADEMHTVSAPVSCALKHLYAYEYILQHNLDGALIMEDDMILYSRFEKIFEECMRERVNRGIDQCILSFEDSSLKFVKGSVRKKGQHIYPAARDRFTGCYYISASCARAILDYVSLNKCDLPIDLFHTKLIKEISLPYYWSHPTIATQGSHCGLFLSSISEKSAKKHLYRKLTWSVKRLYKTILYRLR